jgi:hypothetical protein
MAAANSNIQLSQLDFADIKASIINYLKSQDTFKDYNFSGSGLSTLIDILAYNTQYNAFYLNMVGNEMFLDTALQRESVVSHAKLLGYTPRSAIAPDATINLTVYNTVDDALTLPIYTNFLSQAIDGINYNFVTSDEHTENIVGGVATFNNIVIKQGSVVRNSFVVDSTANPNYIFEIPDANIDTTTLKVYVQNSSTDTTTYVYKLAEDFLTVQNDSKVYYLQEGISENYEIYFGDGVLGNKLIDGNIVIVTYISTEGTASTGANSFVLLDSVYGFANTTITPVTSASNGTQKESIDSIKFTAPKAYSAQGRAVSKEDYISIIQNNKLGITFDAVNVWGGQENNPPVYGQVFVALKPTGAYLLTDTQKQRLISDVIRPISLMTVEPTIIDPDYVYIQVAAKILYDPKNTNLTANEMKTLVNDTIRNYAASTLNTFNSVFSISDFNTVIKNANRSILSADLSIRIQKKFLPSLTVPTTYNLYYNTSLKRALLTSGLTSYPAMQFKDPLNLTTVIDGIYLEEIPTSTGGIESILLLNPGFGYEYPPKVTVLGDGTGATAEAIINAAGNITKINVTNKGSGYTSAIVKIENNSNDTTGKLGAASPILEGRYGTIRSYYYTANNTVKTVYNSNVGTIDYQEGILTLNNFAPVNVDNDLSELTLTVSPENNILYSSYNRILTVDPYDPGAVQVTIIAKP